MKQIKLFFLLSTRNVVTLCDYYSPSYVIADDKYVAGVVYINNQYTGDRY